MHHFLQGSIAQSPVTSLRPCLLSLRLKGGDAGGLQDALDKHDTQTEYEPDSLESMLGEEKGLLWGPKK